MSARAWRARQGMATAGADWDDRYRRLAELRELLEDSSCPVFRAALGLQSGGVCVSGCWTEPRCSPSLGLPRRDRRFLRARGRL